MIESVRALLKGKIDFAGLFPPAELAMDEAVRKFSGYRLGEHGWILSRFVCPVSRLTELDEYSSLLFVEGQPIWRIAATAAGGDSIETFLTSLLQALEAIAAFGGRHGEGVRVELIEMKLPGSIVASGQTKVRELVERAAETIATSGVSNIRPYYEISFKPGGPAAVAGALTAMKQFNQDWASEVRYQAVAAKVRTGGLTAAEVPTAHEVAFFLAGCTRLGVPFKATAGLHHPLRGHDASINATTHGFLNVLASAALASGMRLELARLMPVIECTNRQEFEFGDSGLRWRDLEASLTDIASLNAKGFSFGSCSFEDPIAGLKQLDLL